MRTLRLGGTARPRPRPRRAAARARSRLGIVTSDDIYRAIQEGHPYPVRGLVGFGANLLLAHADSRRGRAALAALDFYVHADLFMNPTAELADIVLPVATPFEREALKIGFDVSAEAQSLVQLRPPVVEPRGEARADTDIVFDLACRLGLGAHFWDGDIEAAYRHQLGPSGVSLDTLRENPGGVRVPLQTRYRKYAEQTDGIPNGFATPTRKIELYSETFLEHGYPPLPDFDEPLVGPVSRPDLAERYPLILTCAKNTQFCESQHRALPSLRRRARDPEVELHPDRRRRARHRRGRLGRHRNARGLRPRPRSPERDAGPRALSAASTAGGRPAPRSAPLATTPSARTAPTST